MYLVTVNAVEHKVDAKGVSIESGTLIFYSDEACTQSRLIVVAGKWEMLKVGEESSALQIQKTERILESEQAGSVEDVRKTSSEEIDQAIEEAENQIESLIEAQDAEM